MDECIPSYDRGFEKNIDVSLRFFGLPNRTTTSRNTVTFENRDVSLTFLIDFCMYHVIMYISGSPSDIRSSKPIAEFVIDRRSKRFMSCDARNNTFKVDEDGILHQLESRCKVRWSRLESMVPNH